MAPHPDYPRTRLFVESPLAEGASVALAARQAHYLARVLRMKAGDAVALFNGRDGEWRGVLEAVGKKEASLRLSELLRPQTATSDLWLLAAPLKNGKTEDMLEKATELGISRFCPVTTQFTVVGKINETRLLSIATEAAEQCERLDRPEIAPLTPLARLLGDWPDGRRLIFGDESGQSGTAREVLPVLSQGPCAVLIGPEGGFSAAELDLLRRLPYVTGVCLGPRVLRADTAAIASLTLVQAFGGGWDGKPAFRQKEDD